MQTAISRFRRSFRAWEAKLDELVDAEDACYGAAAASLRAEAESIERDMLGAQQDVREDDVKALAEIARAHNPDLTSDDPHIDLAAIGRLIEACLKLGGRGSH
jgi:hypothetical protein